MKKYNSSNNNKKTENRKQKTQEQKQSERSGKVDKEQPQLLLAMARYADAAHII